MIIEKSENLKNSMEHWKYSYDYKHLEIDQISALKRLTELLEIELFFDITTVFTLNWIVTYNCNCFLTLKLYLH